MTDKGGLSEIEGDVLRIIVARASTLTDNSVVQCGDVISSVSPQLLGEDPTETRLAARKAVLSLATHGLIKLRDPYPPLTGETIIEPTEEAFGWVDAD